mgnify:CR=1 FL=1
MKYKELNDSYYKYKLLISFNDIIEKKYNIDLLSIGMKLYDKYKSIKIFMKHIF